MDRGLENIVQINFFGFFSVTDPEGRLLTPKGKKTAGVLAYLAFHQGKEVNRERIIDLLWSDRGLKQGQDSLRQAIFTIRKALGGFADEVLSVNRVSLCVNADSIASDLFHGSEDAYPRAKAGFLEGLDYTSPVFDEWLLITRRELTNHQISAAERRLAAIDPKIDGEAALRQTEIILALDPLNEPVARAAMRIHASNGRVSHARRIYEELCANLRADDLEVSVQTRKELEAAFRGNRVTEDRSPTNPAAGAVSKDRGIPTVDVDLTGGTFASAQEQQIVSEFSDRLITRMVQMPEIRFRSGPGEDGGPQFRLIVGSGPLDDGIRVSMRLVAPDGQFIWSDRVQLGGAPTAAQSLAAVDRLVMQMLPALEDHIYRQIDGQPRTAYGHFLFSKRVFSTAPTPDYIQSAMDYLHRSVEVDPDFLPSYSHLVMFYNTGFFMSKPGADHAASRRKAMELSQKLLFLNSKHANAHICMAWCLLWRFKFDAAERSLRRSMELSPYDPHRLSMIGTALVYLGHQDEAEAYYEMAQDRLHHDFDFLRTDYGELYFLKREFDKAVSWMEIPEARTPYKTYFFRALANSLAGRTAAARKDVEAFAEDMRPRWVGPMPFRIRDGFQWYSNLLPLRSRGDRRTLAEGMEKLNIPVTIRDLA